jgi:simple sugar transport system permease protein
VIEALRRYAPLLSSGIGLVAVLAIATLLIALAGANPLTALAGLIEGALGDRYSFAETIVHAAPIALVALGVAPALRAGIFPVGSEGQLAIGAAVSTAAILAVPHGPAIALLPLGCVAGAIGGAAWALLPAVLRARYRVNEILSTLLMNYLAANLLMWLLRTGLATHEDVATPRSDHLPAAALIPKLLTGTRLHWGIIMVAVGALVLAYWVRSVRGLGYDIFGTHPGLAARMGVAEAPTVLRTMLVAGATAGIAGWIQVAGLEGTLYPSVAGGLGFTGVLVALLGGLAPLGILIASLVLAALATGSDGLQIVANVPASIATVLQGLLLLGAGLLFAMRQRRARQQISLPAASAP